MASKDLYYVPHGSKWPIVGTLSVFTFFLGSAMLFNHSSGAKYVFVVGIAALVYMFIGWFSDVISESRAGNYNKQVDVSFRMGMGWFILSEVMFFAAFFGALFYARMFSIPWLNGEGLGGVNGTHEFLWSSFEAVWPTNVMPLVTWWPSLSQSAREDISSAEIVLSASLTVRGVMVFRGCVYD